jgi:hypothetical protein
MGVKSAKTVADKRHLSYNIVNAIGGKYLKAPRKPNKKKNIMAIFLRTEIIGLKDWIYWAGVLVSSLRCKYN